jgi:hypothetical protein
MIGWLEIAGLLTLFLALAGGALILAFSLYGRYQDQRENERTRREFKRRYGLLDKDA